MAVVEVERKKGISYKVVWYENGKQRSKTFKTKREANAYDKDKKAEIQLGIAKAESNITFEKYSKQFAEIHMEGLKDTTKENYKRYIKILSKTFGQMKVVDITPMILDKYFLKLRKQRKLKMNTIRKYRDMLNVILNDAYKKDIILVNPMDKLAFKFTVSDAKTDKLVSRDDLLVMLNSFEVPYYKHFTLIGIMTGMRKGEILALRWRNVDLDKREILVADNLNKYGEVTDTKNSKSRKVYIHENLYYLLEEIKFYQKEMKQFFGKGYMDNDLVICKQNGEFLNTMTVSKAFYEKSKTHNIKVTPHMLRHTFASLLIEANQKDVQELLGHSDLKMTDHYQHHTKYSDETKEKMDDIFKGL